ncbi:MAG: hypothetical protein Q7U06_01660, partial [Pseudomonadota bacterium]|nr:hypothetical protein [Pseudomonadota bacterium]
MTKSTHPGPPSGPEELLIEIDPSLIEEALAAVERGARASGEPRTAPPAPLGDDGEVLEEDIELSLEPTPTAVGADD